ncbi:MAG TPA: hypothetical protein VJP89_16905 [Pyrinomonadaceae bacterium]|nr:hypothetical protein [Pyrinomonadaceae bacterium]
MRKLSFAFPFLLLLVTNVAAQISQTDPHGWITFAPEGGKFSILFPTQPVETINKKTAYTLHTFTTTANRATYVATYSDYEEIKLEPAAFLAANRDRFNKGLQATLVSSRDVTLDGHTGLEFVSENPAANIRSQVFLIEKRLFQIVTFVLKDTDQTQWTDKFFASFKFTPQRGTKDMKN